jgi:hypothetical protein
VIVAVPAERPVTLPDPSTEAFRLLLYQAPPLYVSLRLVTDPKHTVFVPKIADGTGFTVTTVLAVQPVERVYVTPAVPAVTPVTIPEVTPIVAIPVALLLQVPPAGVSPRVIVEPAHTLPVLVVVIGVGNELTVTVVVAIALQPEPAALIERV